MINTTYSNNVVYRDYGHGSQKEKNYYGDSAYSFREAIDAVAQSLEDTNSEYKSELEFGSVTARATESYLESNFPMSARAVRNASLAQKTFSGVSNTLSYADDVYQITKALLNHYEVPPTSKKILSRSDDRALHSAERNTILAYNGVDLLATAIPVAGQGKQILKSAFAIGWTGGGDSIKGFIEDQFIKWYGDGERLLSKDDVTKEIADIDKKINTAEKAKDAAFLECKTLEDLNKIYETKVSNLKKEGGPDKNEKIDLLRNLISENKSKIRRIKRFRTNRYNEEINTLQSRKETLVGLCERYKDGQANIEKHNTEILYLKNKIQHHQTIIDNLDNGDKNFLQKQINSLRNDNGSPEQVIKLLEDKGKGIGLDEAFIAGLRDKYLENGDAPRPGNFSKEDFSEIDKRLERLQSADLRRNQIGIFKSKIEDAKYKIVQQRVWDGEQIKESDLHTAEEGKKILEASIRHYEQEIEKLGTVQPDTPKALKETKYAKKLSGLKERLEGIDNYLKEMSPEAIEDREARIKELENKIKEEINNAGRPEDIDSSKGPVILNMIEEIQELKNQNEAANKARRELETYNDNIRSLRS